MSANNSVVISTVSKVFLLDREIRACVCVSRGIFVVR